MAPPNTINTNASTTRTPNSTSSNAGPSTTIPTGPSNTARDLTSLPFKELVTKIIAQPTEIAKLMKEFKTAAEASNLNAFKPASQTLIDKWTEQIPESEEFQKRMVGNTNEQMARWIKAFGITQAAVHSLISLYRELLSHLDCAEVMSLFSSWMMKNIIPRIEAFIAELQERSVLYRLVLGNLLV